MRTTGGEFYRGSGTSPGTRSHAMPAWAASAPAACRNARCAHPVARHVDRHQHPFGAPDQLRARHQANQARVRAVVAVIPERQKLVWRDRHGRKIAHRLDLRQQLDPVLLGADGPGQVQRGAHRAGQRLRRLRQQRLCGLYRPCISGKAPARSGNVLSLDTQKQVTTCRFKISGCSCRPASR